MKTPAAWKTLFESSAFARQTNYSGPLGPEYNPSGTRLRLWAPTAQSVSVNLYRRGDGGACMGTLPLEQHGQGVWSVYLPGDQHGHYYTFTVEVDGTAYETGDPYARTAGVNGLRSMILDAPRIDPPDWSHDHRVIVPASRRTVWEVSVRDFSQDPACGVRNAWRGKFMAFTQKGTTLSSAGTFPTCLDYLKRLGVGYVQLMPIFDFGSVDESRPLTRQYNWGYDPTNYNVPEGSYSTDPAKGEVRVRECKEMIAALHAAGIGVVYQIERLPLLSATAIHAGALYLDYLLIYLLNNWIPRDWAFIGVFTLCFAVGYALIWGIILLSIRHRTNRINRHLRGGK